MANKENTKDEAEGSVHQVDTVPPPSAEMDAYSAPTAVREVPPEILEAARKRRAELNRASAPLAAPPPPTPPPPPADKSLAGEGATAPRPRAGASTRPVGVPGASPKTFAGSVESDESADQESMSLKALSLSAPPAPTHDDVPTHVDPSIFDFASDEERSKTPSLAVSPIARPSVFADPTVIVLCLVLVAMILALVLLITC